MIQIDIDADLNMVDDEDRNLARLPANSSLKVGGVAVAGRPGFWSWVVIEEIDESTVFFRQGSEREAAAHGDLTIPASAQPSAPSAEVLHGLATTSACGNMCSWVLGVRRSSQTDVACDIRGDYRELGARDGPRPRRRSRLHPSRRRAGVVPRCVP